MSAAPPAPSLGVDYPEGPVLNAYRNAAPHNDTSVTEPKETLAAVPRIFRRDYPRAVDRSGSEGKAAVKHPSPTTC